MIASMLLLIRRMAQVAEQMHDQKLSFIAKNTVTNIQKIQSSKDILKLKDQWMDFLITYDNTFLDKLSIFGSINKKDLKSSVEKFVFNYNLHIPDAIAQLLIEALMPSTSVSMNDVINLISSQINKNINILDTNNMQVAIRDVIKKRKKLDRDLLQDEIDKLNKIVNTVFQCFIEIIQSLKIENSKEIQSKLKDFKFSNESSLTKINQYLQPATNFVKEKAKLLDDKIKEQQFQIYNIQKKNISLENQLKEANKERRKDYLTNTYNKKALQEKLSELNSFYKRFKHDFSLLFIDINFLKKINDTYGYDAWDMILKTFAKVLKAQARTIDFIARFNKDEFAIILPETTEEGARKLARRLCFILQKNSFIYKDKRIKITISVGITQRSKVTSIEDLVNIANNLANEAKNNNRNVILPK